ncbi:kunitz-type protease inhibitor 2 isoform X5 [Hippocampus comes]|uniref:kunitz-type protease inhibitor 2 isoform X5 n=1 Tax=Hippocampus comes TaxID=109280 RepID=UPI00094F02F0|nr:PREDICTED: kunitz-type protease inhibitor 2-like isoform X5 [Hippocampus comes]
MNMKRAPLGCALWFLCVGLVVSCDWRPLDNDLGAPSFDAGATILERLDISDPADCREECCNDLRCQMALLGFPADGPVQCLLVRCLVGGHNVCELNPSSQFQVVGWKKPLMAVPFVENSKPSRNESTNPCLQPMKVGSCRAAFPKFYYDVVNQTCRSFTYGGCDANGNNFESREDCEATCNGVTGSVLPEASTAARPRSSVKSLRMAQPIDDQSKLWDDYDDEVLSAEDYSVSVGPTPKKLFQSDLPSVSEDDCLSSPDPGPCRAAFPKFYYDPATGSCQSFIYGGCGGNKNQFSSAEECQTRCSGVADGNFAGRDKTRSRWTAAFFVLLTLAAICTVLVSTLVVTMLRRLSVTRRASVVSDKEELLPEVRSSLESLNIPVLPVSGNA